MSRYYPGGEGDDVIEGSSGNDYIYGYKGNDELIGKDGNDYVDAGEGDDKLYGDNGDDYLKGMAGNDTIEGGLGNDRLYGYEGNDNLNGDRGHDYLYGHEGDDVLLGGIGNDYLDGGSGNDTIDGGSGRDYIKGNDGDDLIISGSDNADDYIYGNEGADTFRFKVSGRGIGNDTIKDFSRESGDKLEINGEGIEYSISQERNGKHIVTLTNQDNKPMGTITVYGYLSTDDITGTATDANYVEAAPQQPLARPTPELDQLEQMVEAMEADLGLLGRISDKDFKGGLDAAQAMNAILVTAVEETGVAPDGHFSVNDTRILNSYIRKNHLQDWIDLHGDDENGEETGFHLIQNDGATTRYRNENLVNTVADGIYHLGFKIVGDRIYNEDGDANAKLTDLADWMTQLWTDRSTTGTGFDRITDLITADGGLDRNISDDEIAEAADTANTMNAIIHEAISASKDGDGPITVDDVRAINAYIRAYYREEWTELHGDDEKNGDETGFHLVQNDGANTYMFGENFVNTVADGIYHLGFEIQGDRVLNEDGNANAKLTDLANWLNFFYRDQSDTGTGLDELIDVIKNDRGLSNCTDAGDINKGAVAANELNHILVEAIENTNVAVDNVITVKDVMTINSYIRDNHLQRWIKLHGDDEGGKETGFHLVQNDGGNERYRGDKFINTVIDGIYHLGFAIKGDNILNEDGDKNAGLGDLATWLNNFYLGEENTLGSKSSDYIRTLNVDDKIWGRGGSDKVYSGDGDDQVWGGSGNDYVDAGEGDDKLYGDNGDDYLKGMAGNDTIEGGLGNDRLYGYEGNDNLNGDRGHDYLYGHEGDDVLLGDRGDDYMDGGDGDDHMDGGIGDDYMKGGSGNDTMKGGSGNDYLNGYAGNDTINAGKGSDKVYGYDGDDLIISESDNADDLIYGNSGADTFKFIADGNGIGNDTIKDFSSASGDQLIIGGPDVSFELTQLAYNKTKVSLSNENSDDLGTITVYGQFSVDDVTIENEPIIGVNTPDVIEIA